jgi:hypothetical protein
MPKLKLGLVRRLVVFMRDEARSCRHRQLLADMDRVEGVKDATAIAIAIAIVRKIADQAGFQVLPRRWVERGRPADLASKRLEFVSRHRRRPRSG